MNRLRAAASNRPEQISGGLIALARGTFKVPGSTIVTWPL